LLTFGWRLSDAGVGVWIAALEVKLSA